MSVAYIIEALFEDTLRMLDREAEIELGRVGRQFRRWVEGMLQCMPCDHWHDDFDEFVGKLRRDQVILPEESYHAWVDWLRRANEHAGVQARELGSAEAVRAMTRERFKPPPLPEFPHDKPAPFDPDYPQLRSSGNAIMELYPPEQWVELAHFWLRSYRVPQEIKDAFVGWLEDEQQKVFAHAVDSLPPRLRKLLGEVLAEIDKMPQQERLKEVRELLNRVDLPPELEAALLAHYTGLHERWMQTWGLLHVRGLREPGPARPETPAELLLRVVEGLDKLVAEGRLDELVDALRDLSRRLPEFIPGSGHGGPFEELARELQAMLAVFAELLALLPPDAGEVAIELLQVALGIAGLIPGAGEFFDFASAVISGRRGEWLDVFISGLALLPLLGIAAGIAKISKRLKKLGTLVAKLKGPAREILSHFVSELATALTKIPTKSLPAAINGIKSFIVRLRDLLKEVIAKLRRLKSGAPSNIELRLYGGAGGGHHVPAKKAFAGAPGYKVNKALAIPNEVLAAHKVNHALVTGAQASLYRAFAKTGRPLTWEVMQEIETRALVRGGLDYTTASETVKKAIQSLKDAGVAGPTRIPWGG